MSVGAVVPTIAVLDDTGAAQEGIVPPRVAAAMPIESTHTKFFMIISFRVVFRKSHNFSPTSTACQADSFHTSTTRLVSRICQAECFHSLIRHRFRSSGPRKVTLVSFSPECALMNDVSPISYFGSLMAGSLCERSNLQFVPYIPVIVFTFFQIGDDMY